MKSILKFLLAGVMTALACNAVLAQENGTKDEAKAMVDAAVAHVKKVGPEKAFTLKIAVLFPKSAAKRVLA